MTPETYLLLFIGVIALIIWFFEVSERYIQAFRLRAIAISVLVAAAITPTPDILTCLLHAAMLMGGYLVFQVLVRRLVKRV